MKQKELFELFSQGKELTKQSEMKFKYNKIVRGSFYSYKLDGNPITERQFESIRDKFQLEKLHDKSNNSLSVYKIFTL